jgi:hypothetical protein
MRRGERAYAYAVGGRLVVDQGEGDVGQVRWACKGVKTLGIKLKPDVHAQLSFIAQLREGTITDEIQFAIAERVARAKADPELASKAAEARAEIEREAAARQQAIASLFADGGEPSGARPRRTTKGGESPSET